VYRVLRIPESTTGPSAAAMTPPDLSPSAPPPPLNPPAAFVRVRTRSFELPPIRDALVIGAAAPARAKIVQYAFQLLESGEFSSLGKGDAVIGSILVRTSLLRRIDAARLRRLIHRRVRHVMASTEVLALRIELETSLTG
jgi:hypothetical protein